MALHVVRLPDVGEGVVEAELVQWLVAVGDTVTPESALAEVLTDKATVEIASPVTGVVATLHAAPGEIRTVGSDLVAIELDVHQPSTTVAPEPGARGDEGATGPVAGSPPTAPPGATETPQPPAAPPSEAARPVAPARSGGHGLPALAAPAVRRRAIERGIDLRLVRGSGPAGRVIDSDLDAHALLDVQPSSSPARTAPTETPLRGVRRTIAARMTESWRTPHITYVEEIDLTELERLRATFNDRSSTAARLTVLPFVIRAVAMACVDHPQMNATFDDDTGVISTYEAVHVGVATQTDSGLLVPVVRNADTLSVASIAGATARVVTAARAGRAAREDLVGSTITVSSLGKIGGLATTPILNHPEVAIVGVNRQQVRPVWDGATFAARTMMNLSSSFDHRIVDGWDAATFVQRVRELLETPALLLLAGPSA